MKNVLITGTTSGIGKAFAEKFADEGYDLILVARDEQKLKQQQAALQETHCVAVKYIVQDLTQENAAGLVMADIDKWKVAIDVLVNNAGFNESGFFVDTSLDRELEMISMHIRFATELTKRILVHMKENGYGRILNVGSTGSFIPSPTDAVYSATKAYIMSFSNALCGELRKTGVKVTTLCPGATETEFAAKANIQNTMLFKIAVMSPEKVVRIAYCGMMKGRRLVIPGIYNKLLVAFSKVMPVSITNRITIFMMKQPKIR